MVAAMGDDRLKLVAYAAAAVLLALAALRAFGGCDGGEPSAAPRLTVDGAPARDEASARDRAHADSDRRAGRAAYVHVAGEVRRPGLYRVRAGDRAGVAVERAGGLTQAADGTALNLAARVRDGQQLVVPRRGERATRAAPDEAAGPATRGPGAQPQKISLATATLAQLDTLDGIGPALAKRILDYRARHGGFRSLEQLKEVEGIGEKRFEALRRAVVP